MYTLDECRKEFEETKRLVEKLEKKTNKLLKNTGHFVDEEDQAYLRKGLKYLNTFLYMQSVDFELGVSEDEYKNRAEMLLFK